MGIAGGGEKRVELTLLATQWGAIVQVAVGLKGHFLLTVSWCVFLAS